MNGNLHTQEYWRQLQEGNTDALSALYQLHYVGLINYGVKLTGDRDLANDCFTGVLLELWEKKANPARCVQRPLLSPHLPPPPHPA